MRNDFCLLPDKDLHTQGLFVVEGKILIRRLLRSSVICKSIICSEHQREEFLNIDNKVNIQVLSKQEISRLVGYDFHRGALAVGIIPQEPVLETILQKWQRASKLKILLLPHCSDPQNLGALIRSARALGFTGVIVGQNSCKIYTRRVVRVAMGSMFDFDVVQVADFNCWVQACVEYMPVWGFALSKESKQLHEMPIPQKLAIMLGNEGQGLNKEELSYCTDKVVIPMAENTDSLNIAASGAIAMYGVI